MINQTNSFVKICNWRLEIDFKTSVTNFLGNYKVNIPEMWILRKNFAFINKNYQNIEDCVDLLIILSSIELLTNDFIDKISPTILYLNKKE